MDTQVATNWASSSFWVIVVFIGAFALFGAIMWSRAKNKGITPEENARTERATRDLYDGDTTDESTKGR